MKLEDSTIMQKILKDLARSESSDTQTHNGLELKVEKVES